MKGGFPPGELMKRTSHKKYGTFKDILPLTKWCFCMKCKMEVSREPLWEVNTQDNQQKLFLCKECAPTEAHVKGFLKAIFKLYVTKQ